MSLLNLVFTLGLGAAQRAQQRKARKRAQHAQEEAVRAANAVDIRTNEGSRDIKVVYGATAVNGLTVYQATADAWLATGLNFNIGAEGYTVSHDDLRRWLLQQDVIAVGDIEEVLDVFIDDQALSDQKFDDAHWLYWANGGSADPVGMAFTSERNSNTKFTGLAYCSGLYYLDVGAEDPPYTQPPNILYFVFGRQIKAVTSSGLATAKSYSKNFVDVLTDFLVSDDFGPGIDVDDIDFPSFNAARQLTAPLFGGSLEASAATFHARTYPTARNTAAGTSYSTYGDYITARTDITTANTGLDAKRPLYTECFTLGRHDFNGQITTSRKWLETIDGILDIVPGALLFNSMNGKLKLSIPDSLQSEATQSVKTVGSSEIVGEVQVVIPDATDRANRFTARYSDLETDFAGANIEIPSAGSELDQQLKAADNDLVLRASESFIGVNNKFHARSIVITTIILSGRPAYIFKVQKSCLALEPGDVIRLKCGLTGIDVHCRILARKIQPDFTIDMIAIHFARLDYDLYVTDREQIPGVEATIVVAPPTPFLLTAPVFADDTIDAQSWTENVEITPITVPMASGNPTPTYSASGLPAGVSFNPTTRVISGTPTPALTAPVFADDTIDAQSWTENVEITPITVPMASGNPTPTYSASGLPAGVSFNPTTRVISGTPTL